MKLAVIGSRSFNDSVLMRKELDAIVPDFLVSGGAIGADTLAQEYSKLRGIRILVIYPDYGRHGHGAPIVRNQQIVAECDKLIAFWDGQSRGTKNTIDTAEYAEKLLKVVRFGQEK